MSKRSEHKNTCNSVILALSVQLYCVVFCNIALCYVTMQPEDLTDAHHAGCTGREPTTLKNAIKLRE